jgi:hypothetical protein
VPKAFIIAEPTLVSLRAAAEMWLPTPFSNRSCAFDAEGLDLLDTHDCLLVDFQTTAEAVKHMPAQIAKLEQLGFGPRSGVRMRPLTTRTAAKPGEEVKADQCELTWTLTLDPGSLVVPSWLVDFVLSVIAPYVFHQLVKTVKSLGGVYAERRRMRERLYGTMETRCDQHVAKRLASGYHYDAIASAATPRRGFFRGFGFRTKRRSETSKVVA